MEKFDLTSVPMGFCPECLEQMLKGASFDSATLPDGTVLVHTYCEHREAGALGIIRPGAALRWRIDIPVNAIAWENDLPLRIAAIAGARAAGGGVQTSGPTAAPQTPN